MRIFYMHLYVRLVSILYLSLISISILLSDDIVIISSSLKLTLDDWIDVKKASYCWSHDGRWVREDILDDEYRWQPSLRCPSFIRENICSLQQKMIPKGKILFVGDSMTHQYFSHFGGKASKDVHEHFVKPVLQRSDCWPKNGKLYWKILYFVMNEI